MTELVDNCVGCGILPCHHCKAYVLICDFCGEEEEELFVHGEEELCKDCFIEAALEDAERVTL